MYRHFLSLSRKEGGGPSTPAECTPFSKKSEAPNLMLLAVALCRPILHHNAILPSCPFALLSIS